MPVTSDMMKRTMCGFCVVFQSVSSPVAGTYCASAPRGSIAVGISRCWMMRSLDHDVGLLERRVDVAAGDRPVERDVVRRFGVQLRRARLRRLLRVDDGRQRLVVDVDQVERVVRLVRRLGDDDRDGVADVADDVLGDARDRAPIFKFGVRHAATRTGSASTRSRCRRR